MAKKSTLTESDRRWLRELHVGGEDERIPAFVVPMAKYISAVDAGDLATLMYHELRNLHIRTLKQLFVWRAAALALLAFVGLTLGIWLLGRITW